MSYRPRGYDVIGHAVALLTSRSSRTALQTGATPGADPSVRLFAKNGLLVRTGVKSELIVAPRSPGKVTFMWGNNGVRPTTRHLVMSCPGDGGWIVFPGGYYLAKPACVDLIVRTGGIDHRISVGVGTACAGQRPPPQPTDS
jgi:hypothetical protein